jgi:hypothetical protein
MVNERHGETMVIVEIGVKSEPLHTRSKKVQLRLEGIEKATATATIMRQQQKNAGNGRRDRTRLKTGLMVNTCITKTVPAAAGAHFSWVLQPTIEAQNRHALAMLLADKNFYYSISDELDDDIDLDPVLSKNSSRSCHLQQ